MLPVVLSGGSGTRLWPVSRTKLPKQFCHIFEQSLHSMTLNRLCKLGSPWVLTAQGLKDYTLKEIANLNLNIEQAIFEPFAKNTGPAIALLCYIFKTKGLSQSVVGVFPADHIIENEDKFYAAVYLAQEEAQKGRIVTLGVKPNYPATGYGYIQTESTILAQNGEFFSSPVSKFHEKPSLKDANEFITMGHYFWNAGIFIFKIETMIDAFITHQNAMWELVNTLKPDLSNISDVYSKLDNISIDYAIMEKLNSSTLACISCDIGWNDVGSWDSIASLLDGVQEDKIEVKASNNFVHGLSDKTYAFLGVNDIITVDTKDALLIAKKGSTQEIKEIIDILKLKNPTLLKEHGFEDRPWGHFEVLKDSSQFKSKIIRVNAGQQLSYQSHEKREEHWIVTQGHGEVVIDDKTIKVTGGAYIKIPQGSKHRMRNTSAHILEFVEVQLGSYFGEDDIIRYQDDYLRS